RVQAPGKWPATGHAPRYPEAPPWYRRGPDPPAPIADALVESPQAQAQAGPVHVAAAPIVGDFQVCLAVAAAHRNRAPPSLTVTQEVCHTFSTRPRQHLFDIRWERPCGTVVGWLARAGRE